MKFEAMVIDGDNICWKNYYANSELSYNGMKTGAIFGTIRSILTYHKRFQPEFAMVTWTHSNSKRKEIYPQYKATRKTEDRSDYFEQQPVVEELLSYMGVIQGKIKGYEADDIMANVSEELINNGFKTIIISSDKDMLQMINNGIFVLRNEKLYTSLLVQEEFGCYPKDIPLWLAIKGDKSDNIAGVRQVGEVKLKKLFIDYGVKGLEYHIMNSKIEETNDNNLKRLIKDKELIILNLKIIKFNTQEINPLDNLICTNQSMDKVMTIIEKYGMHSLIKDVMEYMNENQLKEYE